MKEVSLENIVNCLKEPFKSFYKPELIQTDNLFETGALDSMEIVSLIIAMSEKFETIDHIAFLAPNKQ